MIAYRVLGPLAVERDGVDVPVTARRERELLATLLLRPGEATSVGTLVDVLWGEEPPATVETALQVHVSALRKKLGAASIETVNAGYRLSRADSAVDMLEFERLVSEGRRAFATDVPRLAFRSLSAAVATFGGRPFADIDDREAALPVVVRLEELFWEAVEARFEAGLSIGKHAELIPEIRERLRVQPLRERLVAALMLALYRAGRAVEALEAFAEFRESLLEDLGMDPGRALVVLEREILEQAPELAPEFPLTPRQHTPSPPTAMIGREDEMDRLKELLVARRTRLVTLTGPGGTGKTRLAMAVSELVRQFFDDGCGWLDLSEAQPGADILRAVAEGLGVPMAESDLAESALIRALQPFEYLLVIDNFEHLVEQSGALGTLLRECPALQVLTTSREPLRLRAEVLLPIEPLATPSSDEPSAVASSPAARLFVARAAAATGSFALDGSNSVSVARLCRRLDGLPLAVELAAAQLHRVGLAELDGLAGRMNEPGPRDLPARQRTMSATIGWSLDLLAAEQRARLFELVPFVGGFDFDAAASVWGCEPEAARAWVGELLDASLLQPAGTDGRARMLEPIRDFCWAALGLDRATVQMGHLRWVVSVALANRPEPGLRSGDADAWAALLERETPNIRAAVASAIEIGTFAELARLIHGVWSYWYTHGMNGELWDWLSQILPQVKDLDELDGARVLSVAGEIARLRSDLEAAERFKAPALAAAERAGDEVLQAMLLADLSGVASHQGNFALALDRAESALDLRERLGDSRGIVHALVAVGDVHRLSGDLPRARETLKRCLEICKEHELAEGEMINMFFLADLDRRTGDWSGALQHLAHAVELAQRLEDAIVVADGLLVCALIATELEAFDTARELFDLGFQLSREVGYEPDLPEEYARAKAVLGVHGLTVAEPGPRPTRIDATALVPWFLSSIRRLAELEVTQP